MTTNETPDLFDEVSDLVFDLPHLDDGDEQAAIDEIAAKCGVTVAEVEDEMDRQFSNYEDPLAERRQMGLTAL